MVSSPRGDGNGLLRELLSVLVRQYGYSEVLRALVDMEQEKGHVQGCIEGNDCAYLITSKRGRKGPAVSPVRLIEKIDVSQERKRLLLEIASAFSRKMFLPTMSDVRNFLETQGHNAWHVKRRQDAFGEVVKALLDMSDEYIEILARKSPNYGPARLASLSDAIRNASISIRGEPDTDLNSSGDECLGNPMDGGLKAGSLNGEQENDVRGNDNNGSKS